MIRRHHCTQPSSSKSHRASSLQPLTAAPQHQLRASPRQVPAGGQGQLARRGLGPEPGLPVDGTRQRALRRARLVARELPLLARGHVIPSVQPSSLPWTTHPNRTIHSPAGAAPTDHGGEEGSHQQQAQTRASESEQRWAGPQGKWWERKGCLPSLPGRWLRGAGIRETGPWGCPFPAKVFRYLQPQLLKDAGPRVVARLSATVGRL